MKNKLGKMRNRFSHHSEQQNGDVLESLSQQYPLPTAATKALREVLPNNRSRALSSAVPLLIEREVSDGVNFLAYKKCKRELSSRQRACE